MSKALVIAGADFETNRVATISFDGIHTENVEVSPSTIEFTGIGETQALTAALTPAGSVDPVIWSTSDSSVATVSNGIVTSVGVGNCTITATSGSYSDTCSVEVSISQYLTGKAYPRTLTDPNGSGNNALSKTLCDIGIQTAGSYELYLSMMDNVKTYNGEKLCGIMAVNVAESGYDFQIVLPADMEAGTNIKRTYDAIGYPVPMAIPAGTAKIKCIGLSDQYGAHALFFNTSQRAIDNNTNVNGGQYYNAFRQKYTPAAADYEWVYQNNLEFDVPSGYDAVVVVWKTDPNDATAVLPANMTAEQLAEFKVLCL